MRDAVIVFLLLWSHIVVGACAYIVGRTDEMKGRSFWLFEGRPKDEGPSA